MRTLTPPGRPATLLVLALVLPTVVACTGQAEAGPARSGAALPERVHSALVELYAGDDPSTRDIEAAECFADDLLGRVTAEDLREGGVLDAGYAPRVKVTALGREVARAWTAAQMACTDFVEESTQAQEALTKGRLDAEAYATCLEGRLDEATIRDASVSTLMTRWDDPAVGEMSLAQSECSVLSVPRD